jgi:hypothetical protein
MPHPSLETPVVLLAMCEGMAGSERVIWVLIPPVIVFVWGLVSWACIWRNTRPEERSSLLGLLGICAALGGLVFLFPGGVSGDGDYLLRFFFSMLIATGIGLAWPEMARRVETWRSVAVAIAGDVVVPGGLMLLLFWGLAVSGSCLG